MGFWHTGYMEHHAYDYFSATDVQPPVRIKHLCPICSAEFETSEELSGHRIEGHPLSRPILLFRGREIGNTPIQITRRPSAEDFALGKSAKAFINQQSCPVEQVPEKLSVLTQETVNIRLLSNDNVEAQFEIGFSIATQEDIQGVEKCFKAFTEGKKLDRRSIDEFIQRAQPYQTAKYYYDGICQYLYGVLAKEKSSETDLAFEKYPEKFSLAVERLQDYNRPVSRAIIGIIAFNFNQFDDAAYVLEPDTNIAHAANTFKDWLELNNSDWPQAEGKNSWDALLSDKDTATLVQLLCDQRKKPETKLSEIQDNLVKLVSDYDRTKLKIMQAELARLTGDAELAKRTARELANFTGITKWANSLIEG